MHTTLSPKQVGNLRALTSREIDAVTGGTDTYTVLAGEWWGSEWLILHTWIDDETFEFRTETYWTTNNPYVVHAGP